MAERYRLLLRILSAQLRIQFVELTLYRLCELAPDTPMMNSDIVRETLCAHSHYGRERFAESPILSFLYYT